MYTIFQLDPDYNPEPSSHMSIAVHGNGDVTVVKASLELDNYEVFEAVGASRRDPQDSKNNEIGVKLALGRAIRQIGRDILREAQDGVREAEIRRRKQLDAAEAARFRKEAKAAEYQSKNDTKQKQK